MNTKAVDTTPDKVEQRLIDNFVERYKKHQGKQINNSSLHAGSSMYFYCRYCAIQTAVLPESYITPPPKICDDCEVLQEKGLIEMARKAAQT